MAIATTRFIKSVFGAPWDAGCQSERLSGGLEISGVGNAAAVMACVPERAGEIN